MFEKFKTIKIKGGCFDNEAELELFKKDALSVIYGRNGSGKTTIAHCIGELVKSDEEKNADFTVSSTSTITTDKKDSVFIFNEDFVREQVRVEKDGINTIVMLGEQVELDEQIAQKKEVLAKLEEEFNKLDEERKRYDNARENISPLYYFNQIRDALRADGGWADIDRDVKRNTVKSRISEDVINTLLGLEEPTENYNTLHNRVMNNLNLYRGSEDAQVLTWIKGTVLLPEELTQLIDILIEPLDTPELTDREHRLLELLAKHPQHSTEATKQMVTEGWSFCPMCLREITEQDKATITQTLTHILNEEASQYEHLLCTELETFAIIETVLPEFREHLNEQELNVAQTALANLNRILYAVQQKINQRKSDIYKALKSPFSEEDCRAYADAVVAWRKALDAIEECVKRFNDSVNKRTKLYKQIRTENSLLARKQHSALLRSYKQAKENSDKNRELLDSKSKEREKVQMEIKSLKTQKERTDIALDYINHELQYVFYSNRKVVLEPGDGCYKLRINGKAVRPKKISVGERNVLGLCYFFAKLFGGKTETAKYSSEYLIVIDDPVSSFDHGNRVGVMSLLRFQFGNILKGNTNSRILVLSHDLQSIFDLMKIRNEVIEKNDPTFMELVNHNLKMHKSKNEYKKLLECVFEYASKAETYDIDDISDISIGNTMRRLLEAYSSFCYDIGFEKMLRKHDILMEIPEDKRVYYANFMYRLTLNTESHMEENIYTLNGITARFTKDEKIQTAKSVLLFLLYINKPHLEAYLSEHITEIENWKNDEEKWILSIK